MHGSILINKYVSDYITKKGRREKSSLQKNSQIIDVDTVHFRKAEPIPTCPFESRLEFSFASKSLQLWKEEKIITGKKPDK